MSAFLQAQRVLADGIASRVAPCAVIEVGDRSKVLWTEASGRLTLDGAAQPASEDTVFDLASLTKVLATTAFAMGLVADRRLDLDARVGDFLPGWRGEGRETVRIRDLLAHSSGLPAHRPLYRSSSGRTEFERAVCSEPLDYPPGTKSIYSDLGFILLGFVLEDASGDTLDRQFDMMCRALTDGTAGAPATSRGTPLEIRFRPPAAWRERIAPTRAYASPRGEPYDENAAALDGVAGHAGLFGTASAVGTLARAMLNAVLDRHDEPVLASHEVARHFVSKAGVAASSRALGWDTMLTTSSCGTRMSERAFGHTGFTGTSLWVDPGAGIYVVLLTNRVYPACGTADGITRFRRAIHDAVMSGGAFSNRPG